MTHRIATLILMLIAITASASAQSTTKTPSTLPIPSAADWSHLPTSKWPQIVLTNSASFDGHTSLEGASSFLMRLPNGEVVVGTAKHLIKKPGGVEPPISLPDLDGVLKEWKVFPRTKEDEAIDASGVDERTNGESQHDWLLLHLKGKPASFPSTVLVPRPNPVQVGEKVYLIGVSYSDPDVAQNVYEGVVNARPKDHYFTYTFKPPVHIAGFSGAPIVDANGLLVGHGVSMSKGLRQENGMEVEFGGEDASLALELWKHRNDPIVHPADVLHLSLPDGWTPRTSKYPNVLQVAENRWQSAYFELIADPRGDFTEDTDLKKWASLVKSNIARKSTLSDRDETNLKSGQIGDRKTEEYEVTGDLHGIKIRFRMVMLEVNGCYCKFAFWTTPSHWDDAQSSFDEVVKHQH